MNKQKIIGFGLVLIALIIADTLWFILSLDRLYRPMMGDLLAKVPNLWAALGFYIVYAIGLCHFVVFPSLGDKEITVRKLVKNAAMFGLVAFATYDLTALAVIANFNAILAFIDMAWGVSAAVIVCTIAVFGAKRLAK